VFSTWTSPDGNTHNQIGHILIEWQRQPNVLDVLSFRASDCDTDHYLVVPKVSERLVANKQKSNRFLTEIFNPKKLNGAEGKEKYSVEISNRSAGLEDMDTDIEINSAWKLIIENIKISAKESLG
jgi:hypothetical protein